VIRGPSSEKHTRGFPANHANKHESGRGRCRSLSSHRSIFNAEDAEGAEHGVTLAFVSFSSFARRFVLVVGFRFPWPRFRAAPSNEATNWRDNAVQSPESSAQSPILRDRYAWFYDGGLYSLPGLALGSRRSALDGIVPTFVGPLLRNLGVFPLITRIDTNHFCGNGWRRARAMTATEGPS